MEMYTLTIEDNPTSADVQRLSQGLSDHALPYVTGPGFEPLGVFLRDEKGTILGGAWGHVNWNWFHLSLLWVSDVLRGGGYGRQLIEAIEGLDHVVGHLQNPVALGKGAEGCGITKPLRNQPVSKITKGGRCYDRGPIEQAAKERGCTYAHLDTFSFQARPFYERLGYKVFSTLDDYPHGHQKFFMKKELQ